MADIVRIVIKGASGYCCFDDAFNDRQRVTVEWFVDQFPVTYRQYRRTSCRIEPCGNRLLTIA